MFKTIGSKIYRIRLVPQARIENRVTKMQERAAQLPDGPRKALLLERIAKLQAALDSAVDNQVEIDNSIAKTEAEKMATVMAERISNLPVEAPAKAKIQANLDSLQAEIIKISAIPK